MIIKNTINVKDDRLINGLVPVLSMMTQINTSDEDDVLVDFSKTRFISPVFALSLLVYKSSVEKNIVFTHLSDYMKTFHIDDGIMPDIGRRSEFLAKMEGYAQKTYLPVINFPAKSDNDDKEEILSVVENLIIRQLGIQSNVAVGLKYMVDETIDNITEHSESNRGYICAQAYPKKGYLDICIADKGITLLGSYTKLSDNEIVTDIEAVRAANRCLSSKNLPDAENRGYGIYTSKRMLIEGLGGQYMIMSGGAGYMYSRTIDESIELPKGLRWNGTIVAFRIPYVSPDFNYINFIE